MRCPTCIAAALVAAPAVAGDLPAGVERAELAVQPLVAYPWATAVGAFDTARAVHVAVDPFRHPGLAGATIDVWIVEARTPGEWSADPALVGAAGAALEATITGPATGVAANVFAAAAAGVLAAGPGFGHGYDVVLDVDRDGVLSDGDVIDDGPGFFVVPDAATTAPHAVDVIDHDGGPFLAQRIYRPLALDDPAPLVVISHGWTHHEFFYDYLGEHLAANGYVVMAHENDVGAGNAAGTQTAALTTISNIDHFLGNLDTIGGGVLDGAVDGSRIALVGHSTGGEGVVRAVTRLRDGLSVPAHFALDDVVLLCPIAPVSFWPIGDVDPGAVNLHMFVGGADTDVSGAPLPSYTQPMSIFERGTGDRSLTYVQGAGHGHFHDAGKGPAFASGPDLIGYDATHAVVRGTLLPLLEWYARGNVAALDFLRRMDASFRAPGIPANVILAREYRDAATAAKFVIDDFQSAPLPGASSSGGAVTASVSNLREVDMEDLDGSFDFGPTVPANGMTRNRFAGDTARCVVFDWNAAAPGSYELELVPAARDVSRRAVLSFRVAQGTRHPETDALDGALSFTATLVDGCGRTSAIDFGVYGAITRPYERTGFGTGAGWQNEFSTVRIPLRDFASDGLPLDFTNIVAVRFEFGPGLGSPRGRIGLDDVELIDSGATPPGPGVACCAADTNGDGAVDVTDLVNVILDWNTDGAAHGGDVDGTGLVDVADLVAVILGWGPC